MKINSQKAFTLVEILVVIILLGALALLISGAFVSALRRGRDAKRKSDLTQIQRGIEFYYEDQKAYPTAGAFPFGGALTESNKNYMLKIPNDPTSTYSYSYTSDGTYYRLFSCIENTQDQGLGVSQNGFTGAPASCNSPCICKYVLSSPNISPLPTNIP